MPGVVRLPGPPRWSRDAGAQSCPAPRIPVIRNVNVGVAEQRTLAARVADSVAVMIGSWCVIGSQSALPALQVTFSVNGPVKHWDPWPFILLHLALSVQAARAAPTIRMRQDRQAAKGCMMAGESFRVNREAEDVIRAIITPLVRQERVMREPVAPHSAARHTGAPSTGGASRPDPQARMEIVRRLPAQPCFYSGVSRRADRLRAAPCWVDVLQCRMNRPGASMPAPGPDRGRQACRRSRADASSLVDV
jgi:uncharacterized membrane protein